MGILKAISCNSGYTPFLQTQALGPVNAHIALRNSPIFGFRAEGTSWHRLWPCAGTRCPPTHGFLFILSCMLQIISEATHVHVNPHHGPACSAVPGGTIPVPSQERGVGDTILPLRVRDPRRPSATNLLTRWPDGVCVGVSAVRRAACSPPGTCRGTPAPARTCTHVFLLSLLLPFAWCLLWCKMLLSNKGVGTAHNMWQICRLKVISWVLLSGREIHRESMPTLHSDYFQQRWKRHLERSLV